MRYAIIAALVSAAAAVPLTETIYDTQVYTITSCGPEVTDCPAKKTTVVSSTTCTEEYAKTTSTVVPPVYMTSSSMAVPTSTVVVPPPYNHESWGHESWAHSWAHESSWAAETSTVVPPPYKETSTAPVVVVTSKATETYAMTKPTSSMAGTGTVSTGVVPYKTTSAMYQPSKPATYTGAASQLNAAGFVMGAGAFAALFL